MYLYVCIIALAFLWLFWPSRNKLPVGPKGMPLIGILNELDTAKPHVQFMDWAPRYGPIYSFRCLGQLTVLLNDSQLVKLAYTGSEYQSLLNDRPETFFGKYVVYNYSDVGYAMYEDATIKLRKALHKGLHFYGDGVQRFEQLMTKELHRLVGELTDKQAQIVDPRPIIENSVCQVITKLLLGETGKEQSSLTSTVIWDYLAVVNEFMNPAVDTILQKLPFLRFVPGKYRKIYLETIEKRDNVMKTFYEDQKRTYQPDKERGLIDVFFKLQYKSDGRQHLTENQIKGLIMDSIGASMLTSTNSLHGFLLTLLHHPRCIKIIQDELDAAVEADRLPEFDDRSAMPYLEAAMIETLRYLSIFPLMPHSCKQDTLIEGYHIPKGSQIFANTWHIHHDPDIWEEPWTFKPERFLDNSGNLLEANHPLRKQMVAFGVGPRNCLGENLAKSRLMLYMATLLQRFDIELVSNTSADPRLYKVGLILEPPAYTCRFTPRHPHRPLLQE